MSAMVYPPSLIKNIPQAIPPAQELDYQEKQRDHSAAAGVASIIIIPANKARTAAFITNDSANTIYLTFGPVAAVNLGVRLNASGGSIEINKLNLWRGDISVIATGAASNVCAVELETRYAY